MKKSNYNHYNKNLVGYAREKRKEMTKAEACLWKYALRQKKMGYTFNRQRPVLNFIADFMCKKLYLIIEVDGYSHQLEEIYKKDIIRQNKLEAAGYTVLRFRDNEILKNINQVREVIANEILQLENNVSSSPLPPSRGGQHLSTTKEVISSRK